MRELLKLIAFLVLLAALAIGVARAFFVTVVQTDSYSMVPTLVAGDTFLVFTRATLDLGDVAVCRDPERPNQFVVGRVMGLPGSTLAIVDDTAQYGKWLVETNPAGELTYFNRSVDDALEKNVSLFQERFGGRTYNVAHVSRGIRRQLKMIEVDTGIFLLGDNRNLARDSRDYGEVAKDSCLGKAFFLLEPGPDNGGLLYEERRFLWID